MTDRDDTESDRPYLGGPDVAPVFGRLFDQHAAPLHRYLARRVGPEIADDLVSEAFLVALRQRDTYDARQGTVRSWLYGIATNLMRRFVRQEERALRAGIRSVGREESHDEGSRVADRVDAEVAVRRLAAALADLAPGDRDVLLLTSWAGLDSNEVAEALGIPVGTVRSRLHRVRKSLRANGHRQHTAREEESHG